MSNETLDSPVVSVTQYQKLIAEDGTVGNPSITFVNDSTSGLYRIGSDNYGITVGGVNIMDLTTDKINIHKPLNISDDTPSAPTVATEGYIYKKLGDDNLYWITQGSGEVKLSATGGAPAAEYKDTEFKIYNSTNTDRKMRFELTSLVNNVDHVFTVPQSAGAAGVLSAVLNSTSIGTGNATYVTAETKTTVYGVGAGTTTLSTGVSIFGSEAGVIDESDDSVFMGYQAGRSPGSLSTNRHENSVGIGAQAYFTTDTERGYDSVAVGYRAMYDFEKSLECVALGALSYAGHDGEFNVAIGYKAHDGTSASFNLGTTSNTIIGCGTMLGDGTSDLMVAVGNNSFTTGDNLTYLAAVGNSISESASSSNYLVIIGNSMSVTASTSINIGKSGTHTTNFQAGIRGVTTGNADAVAVLVDSAGQLGTVSSSRRYKENINHNIDTDILYGLRPVSFNYKMQDKKTYGLIAEEVEKVLPDIVVYKEVDGENIPDTVQYHLLDPLLLDMLKKQKTLIDNLERDIYNNI